MSSNITPMVSAVSIEDGGGTRVISTHPNPVQHQTTAAQLAALFPQRVVDESGAWQVEANQDPTAASGSIDLEGRLSPDASYVQVDSIDLVDFTTNLSILRANVDMMPDMRIRLVSPSGVSAGTTVRAWVQE